MNTRTSRCELEVVSALAEGGVHVYVAGDDDQSIYGFRHAFPQGIREFPNTYRGASDEELEVCHRCDKEILRLALDVAAQDPRRIAKTLRSASDDDGTVEVLGFDTGAAEAKGVAAICEHLIEVAGVPAGEILVLQRRDFSGSFSKPIVAQLVALGIPATRKTNPFALLDEELGRQVVCVMRLLVNRDDSLAWRELLDLRDNGVGPTPLDQVYDIARERTIRFSAALDLLRANASLIEARNRQRLIDDLQAIDFMLGELEPILDEDLATALVPMLNRVLGRDDVEDLAALFSALVEEEESPSVKKVFQRLQAVRDIVEEQSEGTVENAVRLMTMHAAKGLTASAVIVPNAEDELLPGPVDSEVQEGDERRLLYVSLTRARKYLFVTYAVRRFGTQARAGRKALRHSLTRFLRGIVTPQNSKDFVRDL